MRNAIEENVSRKGKKRNEPNVHDKIKIFKSTI